MKRIHGVALLAVSSLLFQCAAFGQAGKPQKPTSRNPLGYFYCDKQSHECFLKAPKLAMKDRVKFSVREVWQYNLQEAKWIYAAKTAGESAITATSRQISGGDAELTVQAITHAVGLFWVKWTENGVPFEKFLYSGMQCNDVFIGPKRKGDRVAVCVPGKDQATAAYVPDPRIYCVRK